MYRAVRVYHPSHRVNDLAAAEAFFAKVFGRPSIPMQTRPRFKDPIPGFEHYPRDYATMTPIADVLFDCIDVTRYVIDGVQRYPDVAKPHLHGVGWGVDGATELYKALGAAGIRCTDQANRNADPENVPLASFVKVPLYFTTPETSGLRYEFFPVEEMAECHPQQGAAWTVPPRVEGDPLGIDFCAYHTILTKDLPRALNLLVGVLGGQIIEQRHNALLDTDSTFVGLADSVFELGVPRGTESPVHQDWQGRAPLDTYHSITFKVRDLDAVRRHLRGCGVEVQADGQDHLVVDADTALGVPWGFTTATIPGDPREPIWADAALELGA